MPDIGFLVMIDLLFMAGTGSNEMIHANKTNRRKWRSPDTVLPFSVSS